MESPTSPAGAAGARLASGAVANCDRPKLLGGNPSVVHQHPSSFSRIAFLHARLAPTDTHADDVATKGDYSSGSGSGWRASRVREGTWTSSSEGRTRAVRKPP